MSFRENPVTSELLGNYFYAEEDDAVRSILTTLFDNYWDEIVAFAEHNHLPMPTHFLGKGQSGIALLAEDLIVKVFTTAFNPHREMFRDLAFAEYFSKWWLPGFAESYAIFTLDDVQYRWKPWITDKHYTYLAWVEKVGQQLSDIRGYTRFARQAFGKFNVWAEDLTDKGQKVSWEDYEEIKTAIVEFLHNIDAPIFENLLSSLETLLVDDDIILNDLNDTNLGIRLTEGVPEPVIFDAQMYQLNP
jgi:hypothetical protein